MLLFCHEKDEVTKFKRAIEEYNDIKSLGFKVSENLKNSELFLSLQTTNKKFRDEIVEILRLFYDREIIRKILKERHNVVLNNTKLVRSLLKWALLCKIGVVKNASIEKDRKNLFWRVNKSFNLLNYFLSVLLLLPNVFSNKCISIGFSLYGKRTIPRDMLRKFYYKIKNS